MCYSAKQEKKSGHRLTAILFFETTYLRNCHLKHLLLDSSPFRCGLPTHVSKIAHDHFCAFRFTSTTFSTNKNRLTYSFIQHQSATVKESRYSPLSRTPKSEKEITTQNFFYGKCLLNYISTNHPKTIKCIRMNLPICNICNGKRMGTQFTKIRSFILLHHLSIV